MGARIVLLQFGECDRRSDRAVHRRAERGAGRRFPSRRLSPSTSCSPLGAGFIFSKDKLKPDEAVAVDGEDIRKKLFPNGLPSPYCEGFVIIQSPKSLDVTAVYTTAALDSRGRGAGEHSSIDVEQIRERRIATPEDPKGRPDLVPVSAEPSGEFCRRRDGKLIVRVKNVGQGAAGPSTTEVDFGQHGRPTQPTSALAPGEPVELEFEIPPGCFDPDCEFKITVNSRNEVVEENTDNNSAQGSCLG